MRHSTQPPRPLDEHWLLGSLPKLGRDPLRFFHSLALMGDISTFRLMHKRCFFLNHPDLVKRLYQEPNYGKESKDWTVFRNTLGNGLFVSQGPVWLRQRRLMQPAFHKTSIARFGELMTQITTRLLLSWQEKEALNLWEEMRVLSLAIVGEALFGLDLLNNELGDHFAGLERYLIDLFKNPIPFPIWIPTPANRRLRAAQQGLDRTIYALLRKRRSQLLEQADLLSMLLAARDEETGNGMSDGQLRDEIIALLFAGHETTATALTWIWYLLAKYPKVENLLHVELEQVLGGRIPTVEDLPRLLYTRQVIDETLRLWPPAFMTNRRAARNDMIGGVHIPRGSLIFTSSYTMHRHPAYWENASQFNPDRFAPEQVAKRPRYAYIPFGGGPHLCIGNQFALTELVLVTATIASNYRFAIIPEASDETARLMPSLRPKRLITTLKSRQTQ